MCGETAPLKEAATVEEGVHPIGWPALNEKKQRTVPGMRDGGWLYGEQTLEFREWKESV